jgi:hypothetical protein
MDREILVDVNLAPRTLRSAVGVHVVRTYTR